jgi:hypothetical protein
MDSSTQSLIEIGQLFILGSFKGLPLMANILETDYKILNPYASVLLGEKNKREENIKCVVDSF